MGLTQTNEFEARKAALKGNVPNHKEFKKNIEDMRAGGRPKVGWNYVEKASNKSNDPNPQGPVEGKKKRLASTCAENDALQRAAEHANKEHGFKTLDKEKYGMAVVNHQNGRYRISHFCHNCEERKSVYPHHDQKQSERHAGEVHFKVRFTEDQLETAAEGLELHGTVKDRQREETIKLERPKTNKRKRQHQENGHRVEGTNHGKLGRLGSLGRLPEEGLQRDQSMTRGHKETTRSDVMDSNRNGFEMGHERVQSTTRSRKQSTAMSRRRQTETMNNRRSLGRPHDHRRTEQGHGRTQSMTLSSRSRIVPQGRQTEPLNNHGNLGRTENRRRSTMGREREQSSSRVHQRSPIGSKGKDQHHGRTHSRHNSRSSNRSRQGTRNTSSRYHS